MPQLDQTLLFNQIFWLFLSFIYLYIMFIYYLLPSFLKIFKTRKHVLIKNIEQIESLKIYLYKIKSLKKGCLLNFVQSVEKFSDYIIRLKKEKNLFLSSQFPKSTLNLLSYKILYINFIKKN